MTSRHSVTRPTSQELENARTKGQLIGWVQGAAAFLVLGLVLKFIGWIPVIAVAGLGVFIGYKLLSGRRKG